MSGHLILAQNMAQRHGLDPATVAALIKIESNWNPWAFNPEPRYRYLWDLRRNRPFRALTSEEIASERPPADFHDLYRRSGSGADHEWWGQQISWGLMQVMGAVGRERGFAGAYLTNLCDPATNVDLGCRHLRWLLDWADGDVERALAAYNGGTSGNQIRPFRNIAYVERVMAWHPAYVEA